MKKLLISSALLFVSAFGFCQSVTLNPLGDDIVITRYGSFPVISGRRSSGTSVSPTAVINNSNLLFLTGQGHNGTAFTSDRATIAFSASQNWNSTSNGAQMIFSTTPNGTFTLLPRMIIANDGNVGIGLTNPATSLDILSPVSPVVSSFRSTTIGSVLYFYQNTSTATGYLGTYNESANNSIELGTRFGNSTGSVFLSTNSFPRLTVTPLGYIKLGDNATTPAIKMITLTNTTDGAMGGSSNFSHGLTVAKIIDYVVLVDAGGGVYVKENHTTIAGRQFDTEINAVNVRVFNHPTNSGNILTRPLKVVITYSE
jgi:hypothetical protein